MGPAVQGLRDSATAGGGELKACFLKVEMLYEEALYTVLHRAGTMGPDQVDDEEVLLSYLQQVRKAPPTQPHSGED